MRAIGEGLKVCELNVFRCILLSRIVLGLGMGPHDCGLCKVIKRKLRVRGMTGRGR